MYLITCLINVFLCGNKELFQLFICFQCGISLLFGCLASIILYNETWFSKCYKLLCKSYKVGGYSITLVLKTTTYQSVEEKAQKKMMYNSKESLDFWHKRCLDKSMENKETLHKHSSLLPPGFEFHEDISIVL